MGTGDIAPDVLAALRALAAAEPPVGPPRYRVVEHLLGDEADALLDRVVRREAEFAANEPDRSLRRHGWVLPAVPELTAAIAERVWSGLDGWCEAFDVDTGLGSRRDSLELADLAVVAYRDGDHLGPHRDDGRPNGRVLSFSYWMHHRPRDFTGGELRLCGWCRDDGELIAAPPAVDFPPDHDTLVVFPSSTMHEVRSVASGSTQFADARFAITGFVRRRYFPHSTRPYAVNSALAADCWASISPPSASTD